MIDGEWESSSQDPVPKCCARYQEIFGRTMQDPSKVRDFVLWCAVPSQQVICTPYQLSRDHQELADTVAGHIWAHIRPQQVAIEGSNCWFHWSSESELWVSMSHRCGQHIAHWHRRNCITSPLNLGVEKSLETLCNFLQLTVRLAYFRRFFHIFVVFESIAQAAADLVEAMELGQQRFGWAKDRMPRLAMGHSLGAKLQALHAKNFMLLRESGFWVGFWDLQILGCQDHPSHMIPHDPSIS